MREKLLQWLACPACGGALELQDAVREGRIIREGILRCRCGEAYAIRGGVPRMLRGGPDALGVEKATADRFGFEWTRFSDYDCDNFEPFTSPLPAGFFAGKLGLDVGCGAGRHAKQAAARGAEIVAVDLSLAVEAAARNNKDDANVHVVQADVYNLPFRPGTFQFIYSLGVLHHLPDPEKGFHALLPLLRNGGAVFIWLYAHAPRKVALELLRFISQRLANENLRRMAYVCNLIDYGIFINSYRVMSKLPLLGRLAESCAPLRVKEYAAYGFKVGYTDWFDRLSAPITNYYEEDEMRGWLERSELSGTMLRPEGDSWWWLYGERDKQP